MPKTVLIVGADFVPSSLPPSLRIRFFAQHLRKFGWEPVVLTVDPAYYETSFDVEMEKLLPPHIDVVRTKALPSRMTRRLGIGDLGIRSLWHHWSAIRKLCKRWRVDLLFIPVPPFMPMVLGRLTNLVFGIPYVIDYIDPWVIDCYSNVAAADRPPKWRLAHLLSKVIEPIAVRRVAHIVGVSRGTTDGVIERYGWMDPKLGTEIPYGAEASDFDYIRKHPRSNEFFDPDDGLVHLCSVGRGGPDLVPALTAFFDAVRNGLANSPEVFARLRLHFIGTNYAPEGGTPEIVSLAQRRGVRHIVQEIPRRVSFLDAIRILLDANGLLAFGSDLPHYTASKIFPYILAQKPILAIFHENSSVLHTLAETHAGIGLGFSPNRPAALLVPEIERHLRTIIEGPTAPQTDWEAASSYSAEAMSRRLAQVFDSVLTPALSGVRTAEYAASSRPLSLQ